MSTSSFSVANLLPDLNISGAYQRFILGPAVSPPPLGSFKIDNTYIPIVGSPSFTNSEIRNNNLSGYRWIHETQTTDSNGYGSFTLQKFLTASSTGINLMIFNDNGTFSIPGSTDATYIIQTAATNLPNAQVLGSLASGILKNTTTTGVLSIAVNGTDYYSPGHPTTLLDDYNAGGGTPYGNLGVGTNALASLTLNSSSNTNNLAVGPRALFSFTGGSANVAVGKSCLTNLTTASSSTTAMGVGAGLNLTSASQDCFFGVTAGGGTSFVTSSGGNSCFGFQTGGNVNNLQTCSFFGSQAVASASNLINATAIGAGASVGASFTMVMGNSSVTNFNIPGLNFGLTANTITSTNTNGNITITPNGTGIISNSANTAIGTTTANSPLQFSNTLNNRIITLLESTNNTHQYYGFGTQTNTLVYNVAGTGNIHAFYCGTSSSASQELMRITATGTTSNSGCVGINVGTTPLAGLHVVGGVQNITNEDTCIRAVSSANNAKIEISNTQASGKLYELRSSNTGNFDITDRTGSATKFIINTTGTGIAGAPDQAFSVTTGTADKPGGGTWGSFSDSRIKDILHYYSRGLDAIMQIYPVIYKFTAASQLQVQDQEIERIGIVAQDLEKIMPECVTQQAARGFDDLRFYDASPLTYAIINAVKELNRKIDALEGKMT